MNYSFGKGEHLKSRKTIGLLFQEGKQLKKYPLKMMYLPISFDDKAIKIKVAVSVPKRNFKKAVDRNHLKRLMREAYRLQKNTTLEKIAKQYSIMFIYLSKEKISFAEMAIKMEQLLLKFKEENEA
jgi:ribonuclease P protein component